MKWLVIACLLAATPAHAEPDYYPRLSGGAGIGWFLGDVGVLHPSGATFELAGEASLTSSISLRATYEHARLFARDDILTSHLRASLDGVAALVRHPIFGFGDKTIPFGGDMFVLAGVEYERFAFEGGGLLARYEAVVGMGGTVVISDANRRPYQMIEYGLRMMFSRAPDPGKLPFGCDGPCDKPTKTAPYDHTIDMDLAWLFGR